MHRKPVNVIAAAPVAAAVPKIFIWHDVCLLISTRRVGRGFGNALREGDIQPDEHLVLAARDSTVGFLARCT